MNNPQINSEISMETLINLLMEKNTQKSVILALQDVAHASLDDKFSTKEVELFIKVLKPTVLLEGDTRREAILSILTKTFEAIQSNRKGNTMKSNDNKIKAITPETVVKTSGNVIDLILEIDRSDEEKRLGLKVAVNAATSSAISLAMMIARNNRDSVPAEATLETRNQQDLAAEPIPIENTVDEQEPEMTFEAQFAHVMELRNALILEYAPFIRNNNGVPDKFDVLLSPEEFLEFRIKLSGIVNPNAIKRGAEQFNETEDIVREIMSNDAKTQQLRLNDIKGETLDLLKAYEGFAGGTPSVIFDGLPEESRDRLTDRIAEKVNAEYKRLFPIALRTGDLEITGLMTLYKALYQSIKEI